MPVYGRLGHGFSRNQFRQRPLGTYVMRFDNLEIFFRLDRGGDR